MAEYNFDKRIKKLKTSGFRKFKSIDFQMNYLLRKFEAEKSHKGYYPKFEQGDIIFVDFGLNINHEFSNSHFAIVMNQNDTHKEDIINVVPLSSKSNPKYLKINIDMKLKYITNALNTLDNKKKEYEQLLKELDKFNPREMSDEEIQRKYNEFIKWKNVSDQKIDKIDEDVRKAKDSIEKLKNLKSTTYACINSFQPISKFRIKNIYLKEISNVKVDSVTLMMIINRINYDILSLPTIK
ncbi:MAG: type II toxin-antitoxin system PemK/MazF family toxin [Staphylococcus rostri]|uniref:type II toxin-antitoxin system PemK/MazF family toxin n=1 Tax=Staphylococcus rostri TaxID=522262 RepID=UPI0026E04568|nr:type II toxin-antitoxin system PemK/MazF family toxin [Staphylococcus rostri]MDO5374964.1 type II toxin-antitoxin system PemK/MazF family toxin [Staphylococcus rostri]